jgi:acetyl-CoA carboxylase carboxyltransferase component
MTSRPGDGGADFHAQNFTIVWPTGEFGGMGFEGPVRLGYRKEMEAIADPVCVRQVPQGHGGQILRYW